MWNVLPKNKRWWIIAAAVVAGWSILALVLSVDIYLVQRAAHQPTAFRIAFKGSIVDYLPVAFRIAFKGSIIDYLVWAALTPAIFWFAKLRPFSRTHIARRIVEHVIAAVVFSVVHEFVSVPLMTPFRYSLELHLHFLRNRLLTSMYADIWMYFFVVVLWNMANYQQKYHEREVRAALLQSQLAVAKLDALKSQFHPHFLFNTLNSISSLMQHDPEGAEDMLVDLSSLLRHSLADSGTAEHTLANEIQLLETYLRIEKRRFEDRLQIRLKIDTGTLNALIPSLVLQPLVENAVRHGIAPMLRAGTLSISSSADPDGKLRLIVCDDGPGFPDNVRSGIGLSNCRQRLLELYGADHSFLLQSDPSHGVRITIRIPLRIAEDTEEDAYEDASHHRG